MSYKPEKYILTLLWVVFGINMLLKLVYDHQFGLGQTEWTALAGLLISTLVFFFYKKGITIVLFVFLFIGMVNLAQFETRLGLVIQLNVRMPNSPGYSDIQLLSLVLMSVLAAGRRKAIIHFFQSLFNNTEEDLKNEADARYSMFLKKFDMLTDIELERKLKEPLALEAEAALVEIKRKRLHKS